MIIKPGNRLYRCNGCNKEVSTSMSISGIPHCNKGKYEFIKIQPKYAIIQILWKQCEICNFQTLHEIKLNKDKTEILSLECLKCRYKGDDDTYNFFETMWATGREFNKGD